MLNDAILNYLNNSKDETIDLIKQLCLIPSPSHHEKEKAVFVKNWLESIQAKNVYIDDAYNVIYIIPKKDKVVHEMKLNPCPFKQIKSGEKTIELRLNDEKRKQINIGDNIIFTNTLNNEKIITSVTNLHYFDNFTQLYDSLPLLKCGYSKENINNAKASDMEQYYGIDKQKQYGVVGIELTNTYNDDIILFNAHTDTVFPDLTPLPFTKDDKYLYCPGVGDDTTCLAMMLMIAKYITINNIKPNKTIMFVANSCEEGLGNLKGIKEIMNKFRH